MRITSTATSSLINTPIPPIRMSSLVAPPGRRVRDQPGHARHPGQQRRRRGRGGRPVTIAGPASDTNRRTRPAARSSPTSRSAPIRPASPDRLGRQGRQPDRHGRRTVSQGTVSVTRSSTTGGERRRDLRHRAAQREPTSVPADAPRSSRPPTPRCPAAVSPAAGAAHRRPPGGAVPDHHRHRPLPVLRRLRPLRRRLPRRGPDGTTPGLLQGLPGRVRRRGARARRPPPADGPPALDQPAGALQGRAADATHYRQNTRILVTSKSTDCRREVQVDSRRPRPRRHPRVIPGPGGPAQRWMLDSALPFGTYDDLRGVEHARSGTHPAATRRSPTSGTGTTAGSSRRRRQSGDRPRTPAPTAGSARINRLRSQAGVTLVELIVAMAIGMIDRACRLRRPRHVDEAVQRHRRPRQRDPARGPRDGTSRGSCAPRSASAPTAPASSRAPPTP